MSDPKPAAEQRQAGEHGEHHRAQVRAVGACRGTSGTT